MKLFLLFLSTYFVSNIIGPFVINEAGEKELSIDLSSIGISESLHIVPAHFETLESNLTIIDTIRKDGYYYFRDHSWLVKDAYSTYRLQPYKNQLQFKNEIILSIARVAGFKIEEESKSYRTFHLCAYCDASYGTGYDEMLEFLELRNEELKDGDNYKQNFKSLRNIIPAKVYPDYGNRGPILKVKGMKSDLKKLLRNPLLKGVKFEMNDM